MNHAAQTIASSAKLYLPAACPCNRYMTPRRLAATSPIYDSGASTSPACSGHRPETIHPTVVPLPVTYANSVPGSSIAFDLLQGAAMKDRWEQGQVIRKSKYCNIGSEKEMPAWLRATRHRPKRATCHRPKRATCHRPNA